jgi:hypothetical protein
MCDDLSAIAELAAFLGTFPKLQKATINFIMSVCLSIRPRGTTRRLMDGCSWNFMSEYFLKICREIVSIISGKNDGYFTWRPMYSFGHISFNSSFSEKCFRHNIWEKSNYNYKHTLRICKYLVLLHCNNGCMDTPQCHVICTLPLLFTL